MSSQCPRFKVSRLRSVLLWCGAMLAVGFGASELRATSPPDSIPVKNWPMGTASAQAVNIQSAAVTSSGSNLVYVSITPCRVMDTRGQAARE